MSEMFDLYVRVASLGLVALLAVLCVGLFFLFSADPSVSTFTSLLSVFVLLGVASVVSHYANVA